MARGAEIGQGTVGEQLSRARRRRFVGRRAELELFAAALTSPQPPFTVLHVHGPGGVERFTATVASPRHRQALEACALARAMTESVLRIALDTDDAGELFMWLRSLSFVEDSAHGLTLHDLARDVLDSDLRWRDPARYEQLRHRLHEHLANQIQDTTGDLQQRLLLDTIFRVGVGYASRRYRVDPDVLDGDGFGISNGTLTHRYSGGLQLLEHGQMLFTVGGYAGNHPPIDPDGFTAVCSFNPLYGQGMSVAALEALALRDCLRDGTQQLAARFFQTAAKIVDNAWDISVTGDLRLPEVMGRRTLKVRLINAYLPYVHAAAAVDGRVGAAFLRVSNLLDPPPHLLAPTMVWRVLRATLRRRREVQLGSGRPAVASHMG